MPALKQITCSIELGLGNVALPEYQVRYHDGSVKCAIATPEADLPFSIHVVANGYIAPGLACIVFIDGRPQCSRNAACEGNTAGREGVAKQFSAAKTEFRLRQKEEILTNGTYIGRDWTFTKLMQASTPLHGSKVFDQRVGTIEVIILRCHYDKYNLLSVPRIYKMPPQGFDTSGQEKTQKPAVTAGKKQRKTATKSIPSYANQKNAAAKSSNKGRAGSDITVSSGGLHFGNDGAADEAASGQDVSGAQSTKPSLNFGQTQMVIHEQDIGEDEVAEQLGRTLYRAQHDGSSDAPSSIIVKTISDPGSSSQHSSDGFVVQPYWNSNDSTTERTGDTRQRDRGQRARPTLVYPAMPPPTISADQKPHTDRGVQIGKGALYAHETWQPEYIDSTEAPYAVFTFKYCSQQVLEKRLGRSIGGELQAAVFRAEQKQLHAMSRSDLVEQMMAMKERERRRKARDIQDSGGFDDAQPSSSQQWDNGQSDKKDTSNDQSPLAWSNAAAAGFTPADNQSDQKGDQPGQFTW